MIENLLTLAVNDDGTVFEEVEYICTMTGIRTRFLYHWLGEGIFRSVEVGVR